MSGYFMRIARMGGRTPSPIRGLQPGGSVNHIHSVKKTVNEIHTVRRTLRSVVDADRRSGESRGGVGPRGLRQCNRCGACRPFGPRQGFEGKRSEVGEGRVEGSPPKPKV